MSDDHFLTGALDLANALVLASFSFLVHVRVRKPIQVARYKDRADDHMLLREITDELMFEIRELSGQEYVNEYATKKSETLPAETAVVRSA